MPHKIKKSELVYDDYKWTAKADHDNPKYIGGTDHAELNRTEGYEMLYFMNSLIHTWGWTVGSSHASKKLEIIIRTKVPSSIRTHTGIMNWIAANYPTI
jgi:hypothetical protein